MPLISCEIDLFSTWSENCVLTDIITQVGDLTADPVLEEIRVTTNATFKIKDTKLHVRVNTLVIIIAIIIQIHQEAYISLKKMNLQLIMLI